jgi:DNA-binding transcriptional LysR family regulator
MELRHLRYFVAVATEEHMRRAADRLHVAQPALTRQIAALEEEIGYRLFERLPRGLRLNAAGAAFLGEARKILSDVDGAVLTARRASKGEVGRLKLGFIENASWQGPFPNAVQAYRAKAPLVTLELLPMYSRLQLQAIRDEEMDGGFCYALERIPRECSSLHLRTDRVLLAVPRRYGWRKRKDLRLADLADEPFIAIQRASAPRYIDTLTQAIVGGGLFPRVVQETMDESTMLSLVAAGLGLGFVNSANDGRKPQAVDLVPVQQLNVELPLHFVWNKGNESPALTQFLAIVRRQVR